MSCFPQRMIASGWIPSWISELICSTGCVFSSMESSCSLLELSVLQPGEEEEALRFFYPTWAEANSMDLPTETGEPSPPSELIGLLGGSVSSSLAVRHKGKMVGQMLGEKLTRNQTIGKELPLPEEILPPGTPWTPWALFKKAWGARLVDLADERVSWPADVLLELPDVDCVVELTFMAVDKHWRRRCIASALLRRTETLTEELGCSTMVMIASSPITVGMAERRGWKRWRDDDGPDDRLIAFVKTL